MATGLSQTDAGSYDNGVITIPPAGPGGFDANILIEASRTSGVSPCTIVFRTFNSTDPVNPKDSHEMFRQNGWYWDFDDPTSGTYSTSRGGSKNTIVGGCVVAHTFIVADGAGSKNFNVRVRMKDPEGQEYLQQITVTVQAQDDFYAGADTIAVSNTLPIGNDWSLTSYDRNVPSGATQIATLAGVDWDAVDGKRIMLKRGDDFFAEGLVSNILMGQSNIMVSWFGDTADPRPITQNMNLGVKSSGSTDFTANDDQIFANGWGHTITVDGLRTTAVAHCMAPLHFGCHDVDSDWSVTTTPGGIYPIINNGNYGWNGNVTPEGVPMPKGVYVSESIYRSRGDDLQLAEAYNVTAVSAGFPTWLAVIGCTFQNVNEHNMRTQGGQTFAIHDTDFLGNMFQAGKHNLTCRGSGYYDAGDVSDLNRGTASNNPSDDKDFPNLPISKWMVVQRCTMNPNTVISGNAGRNMTFSPQDAASVELITDALIRDTIFPNSPNGITQNVFLNGQWLTSTENTYSTVPVGRTQESLGDIGGDPAVPPGPYYIDQTGESVYALPVPSAPR